MINLISIKTSPGLGKKKRERKLGTDWTVSVVSGVSSAHGWVCKGIVKLNWKSSVAPRLDLDQAHIWTVQRHYVGIQKSQAEQNRLASPGADYEPPIYLMRRTVESLAAGVKLRPLPRRVLDPVIHRSRLSRRQLHLGRRRTERVSVWQSYRATASQRASGLAPGWKPPGQCLLPAVCWPSLTTQSVRQTWAARRHAVPQNIPATHLLAAHYPLSVRSQHLCNSP
jgi:hypothetical protein